MTDLPDKRPEPPDEMDPPEDRADAWDPESEEYEVEFSGGDLREVAFFCRLARRLGGEQKAQAYVDKLKDIPWMGSAKRKSSSW